MAFYFWRVVRFGLGVKELWEMHEFFEELLDVQEVSLSISQSSVDAARAHAAAAGGRFEVAASTRRRLSCRSDC